MTPSPTRVKQNWLVPDEPLTTLVRNAVWANVDQQTVNKPKHPIGFNIRQGVDYAKLLEQVKKMGGCTSLLFHVDAGSLPVLHQFKPYVDVLIWRPREWTSERLYLDSGSPEAWLTTCSDTLVSKGFKRGDVWIHLHNESAWVPEMIEWERRAAEQAIKISARVICLSPAVGTPEQDAIALAHPIIELAGKHSQSVIISAHEYFSIWGNRKKPYYLGRWQWWEQYRIKAGLPPVRYLITEFGSEDIADDHPYTNQLPRVAGIQEVGPVHANDAAWARDYRKVMGVDYPGKDTAYLEQIKIAWDLGEYADPAVVGVLLFSWGV